jgi:uncharacterized protein
MINFLSSIAPGDLKMNKIATRLHIDNKTAENYFKILTEIGMVKTLHPVDHGHQLLSKPAKAYLGNTTLLAASNAVLSADMNVGTMRELAFLQALSGAGLQAFYPKVGDFQIGDRLFEVGGKNKTHSQLKSVQGDKYIVKDNVLMTYGRELPLYLFGFLY